MQQWFKYNKGYVNVNEHGIYLTSTGNWSETARLTEKTPESHRRESIRRFRIYAFFFLAAAGVITMFVRKLWAYPLTYVALPALPFAAYKLYHYLKGDLGIRFMIPRSKVTRVEKVGKNLRIQFINGTGAPDTITLPGAAEKGWDILEVGSREPEVSN